MTSQTGQQIIAIHKLSNISRRKGNQTKKFCQLIEYNMRNIFQNMVAKLVPDPFIKNQNLAYLQINSLNCYKVYFYCISKWRSTRIY